MSKSFLRRLAIVPACLMSLWLVTSGARAKDFDPLNDPVPKATCGHSDHTESGLQGETTQKERSSGDSKRAYNCNLELVGEYRGDGAYSQDGPAYADNCAYYATDNTNAQQQHLGVTVVDVSDPRNPRPTAYLNDTAAARTPHETLVVNHKRHLLAVAQFNGPDFAVYDVSDCRHPVLKADMQVVGSQGHMGNFTPDGKTYYIGQAFRGVGGFVYIIDLSDPSNPKQLPPWQYQGDGRPHGLEFNPEGFIPGVAEGTRFYAGQPGLFGEPSNNSSFGPDGLVIEDVSDYQNRVANPQIRIISKLFWSDQGQAEPMVPVKINGHRYLISSDESGGAGGVGGWSAACSRGASPFGYPQLIDIGDETNPKIVARLRLQVHLPANCSALLAETPPDAPASAIVYNEERCVPNRLNDATMMACGLQNSGLRVFDIHDPLHVREIAYWKPGAVGTEVRPASGSWVQGADATVDKISGWARWVVVDKGNGKGADLDAQLWTVSDGNGFQVLRFSQDFVAKNKDLFRFEQQAAHRAGEGHY